MVTLGEGGAGFGRCFAIAWCAVQDKNKNDKKILHGVDTISHTTVHTMYSVVRLHWLELSSRVARCYGL